MGKKRAMKTLSKVLKKIHTLCFSKENVGEKELRTEPCCEKGTGRA